MNKLRVFETNCFPLKSVPDVVKLVAKLLSDNEEPNIAFMSIVLGIIEHSLTVLNFSDNKVKGRLNVSKKVTDLAAQENSLKYCVDENVKKSNELIPVLTLDTVELFYEKFICLISSNIDMKFYHIKDNSSPSGLVKRISDVIWDTLTRTFYKDKNHLGSLYTMFTEKKMDCYGMGIGVLAGCQLLGLTNLNLVQTEDHCWVAFGPNKNMNMEITWHGKGTEDKRGQKVESTAPENSWVYASPMLCDRWVEFASIVVSMNPTIHSSLESIQLASLQKQILWLLYDAGHLKRYPMALDCLADLEEVIPTPGRPTSLELYREALRVAQSVYDNGLIYPHTFLANYYYRKRSYKCALDSWANAAQVAGRYNYNREDDEMHREFYDVANEIIPSIIRTTSLKMTPSQLDPLNPSDVQIVLNPPTSDSRTATIADDSKNRDDPNNCDNRNQNNSDDPNNRNDPNNHDNRKQNNREYPNNRNPNNIDAAEFSADLKDKEIIDDNRHNSFLEDPWCFVDVLRFFDGMCRWEEGSNMPVLHIIWANNMTFALSRFSAKVRADVRLYDAETQDLKGRLIAAAKNASRTEKSGDAAAVTVGAEMSDDGTDDDTAGSNRHDEATSARSKPNGSGADDKNMALVGDAESKKDKGLTVSNPSGLGTGRRRSGQPHLVLRSEKMSAIKDLFRAERLNTSAIKLQMTAQSQVAAKSRPVEKAEEDGRKCESGNGRKRASEENRNVRRVSLVGKQKQRKISG